MSSITLGRTLQKLLAVFVHFSTSFPQTETEIDAHTLLNFLLHREMRRTLQVDIHWEASIERMQGDTIFRLCKYTCRELPPVLPCYHFAAYYSFPPKKSVLELNYQSSYFKSWWLLFSGQCIPLMSSVTNRSSRAHSFFIWKIKYYCEIRLKWTQASILTPVISFFPNWFVSLVHRMLCLLTYLLHGAPSWESNQFSATQEIPCILWNPKVHYCTNVISHHSHKKK
jgi:hypothetical protein